MIRLASILLAFLAVPFSGTASDYIWMDYRAPGFVHTDLTHPNSNTDYTLLWRFIRQMRAEASGFALAEHKATGSHQDDVLKSDYLAGSIFGTNLLPWRAFYDFAPTGSNSVTNIVFDLPDHWTTNVTVFWASPIAVSVDGNINEFGDGGGGQAHTITDQSGAGNYLWKITGASIVSGGSGYSQNDHVTVPISGDTTTSAVLNVDSVDMGGTVSAISVVSTGVYGSSHESETLATGEGSGNGLTVASAWESFQVSGPFTNWSSGVPFRLHGHPYGTWNSGVWKTWTGLVGSVDAAGMYFTIAESTPLTNAGYAWEATVELPTTVTTNVLNQPTWSTGTIPVPDWENATLEMMVTHAGANEGRILLGQSGLTLYWQVHRYSFGYTMATTYTPGRSGFSWPPFFLFPFDCQVWGDYYDRPLSNIYAMAVVPLSDVMDGTTNVHGLAPGTTGQFTSLTSMPWPCAGTPFGPLQWFGPPMTYWWQGSDAGLSGTGAYLCVLIGK